MFSSTAFNMSFGYATSPTVVGSHYFDPRADAEALRAAMKGIGTDEQRIIDILANRSNGQRQAIAFNFQTCFGKDLIKKLKSELSGNFENLIVALMKPLPQYYASELNHAMKGLGTNESTLIEILTSLTNHEIGVVKQEYQSKYKRSLEEDIKGDTSHHFKRLLVSLCCGNRCESIDVDSQAVFQDARNLYEAGKGRLGTDESTFNAILVSRSFTHLKRVFAEYQTIAGHDIVTAIKDEFSGHIQDGLLTIVKIVNHKSEFFAERLYKSMKGMGTDDRSLIRLVVTRVERDMGEIKASYHQLYGKSLADAIADDTSGYYRKCLLALIS